jgi:sec-independent protein translocase protein TatA
MGSFSPWHLLILAVIVMFVFGGRGKLSGVMGDAAKGIRAFRDGLKDEHETPAAAQPVPLVEADKDPVAR